MVLVSHKTYVYCNPPSREIFQSHECVLSVLNPHLGLPHLKLFFFSKSLDDIINEHDFLSLILIIVLEMKII